MLTNSNRFYFVDKFFFKHIQNLYYYLIMVFLVDTVLSKIEFLNYNQFVFTRFQFLHNFKLNPVIFVTISKKRRFSKIIKI